ncbi:hypothetical protein HD554DRAFT_1125007 [Boletus coccyginus]|nr:hypothetical protein HD554DRAFT_1125007 [Boletus coccyginus]
MTPLIANVNTSASQATGPPALPPNLRMPHVFVIPPEEEQQDNPPWCCFDADEQPENNGDFFSNPDIHFLDVPYFLQPSENDVPIPLARPTSVQQPRLRASMSKKLEKKQRPEAIKIIETKSSRARQRDGREDSDVIEVVKVKRCREALADLEENTKVKRSKTLKARATQALQSIKNVGKVSHRTHVKELWTSSETVLFKGAQEQIRSQQDQTEHRPPPTFSKKRSLSRASSRSLSLIFLSSKPSRPESPFTACVASSVAPAEAHHIVNPSSLPHLRYNDTNPSLNEISSTLTTDDALNNPVPPISSTRKNINTKFSVRELHRLFSFSSSSPDDSPSTATAVSFSPDRDGTMPSTSTLSSDYPDVPMEEGIFADAHFLDLDDADRMLASRYHPAFHTHCDDNLSTPRRLRDLSFEMKLDSLHFDSLSFDPKDFDVSMEGDLSR